MAKNALILVVDDDPTIRLLARKSLAKSNFKVMEARDGEECLAICQRHEIDLIMLDVEMPKLDGNSTCKRLRQHKKTAAVPILMVTGLDDNNSIDCAFKAGATDFITKPINWELLTHRLRYMLRNSQLVAELAGSRSSLANAQRLARLGSWDWHLDTDKLQVSEELYHLLGLEPYSLVPSLNAILDVISHERDREKVKASVNNTLKSGSSTDIKYTIFRSDGSERIIHQQVIALKDDQGKVSQLQGTMQDITEQQRTEEKIRNLAYFDSLTGLPNRQLFQLKMEGILSKAGKTQLPLAILFLDVDNFKRINDSLGHTVGDLFLKSISSRLKNILFGSGEMPCLLDQEPDQSTSSYIARFGGDEFVICCYGLHRAEDAGDKAQHLLEALSQPINVAGHQLSVSVSIGIALFPDNSETIDGLLRNADTALHHAKRLGKNTYRFFKTTMNNTSMRRLALENELQKALVNEEFFLVYQPQLDLKTRQIVGVETLLRWDSPRFGKVAPGEFITLVEESGMIVELGDWVLSTACDQGRIWRNQGLPELRIAVNLSTRQFTNPNFLPRAISIIENTGFDPACLELEITESLLMQDVEHAISIMQALKALGISLAIDDFGTGYSSLSYLQRFPIDRLKIDRSFVKDLPTSAGSVAIAQAIIIMAHSLNLSVIAEGVETESQQAFLIEKNCDEIQGYYISKPLLADEFVAFSQQQRYFMKENSLGASFGAVVVANQMI